ncbi:TerD family protein [Bacillus sp. NPDC077027]|uniref:TerD family protein n=1 Tax=Bacillus sp. NPDC077027 TaxID=3390548 RepID=UPI003CFD98D4
MGIQNWPKPKKSRQLGGPHPLAKSEQKTSQQPIQHQSKPKQKTGTTLIKGQKMDLTKGNPNLDQIHIGLGWDLSGQPIDLDTEIFLLNEQDKLMTTEHLIFYNNNQSSDGSVRHLGDNKHGGGLGDNETMIIQLSKVSPDIHKMIVAVTVHDAHQQGHHFGQVSNAYVRLSNQLNQQEICTFNLTEDYSQCASIVCTELYRYQGEWKVSANGTGTTMDLKDLCRLYGLTF